MAQYKGKTADAASVIMGAKLWKKGMKLEGTVIREFETQNGPCYEISLRTPIKVLGNSEKKVSIGALKGFKMALNAAGIDDLQTGDKVLIECTGTTATNKGNPRVDFSVALDRPE